MKEVVKRTAGLFSLLHLKPLLTALVFCCASGIGLTAFGAAAPVQAVTERSAAETVRALYEDGARIFDGAGLLSEEEEQTLQQAARKIEETYQIEALIVTVNGTAGLSAKEYAGQLYENTGMGYENTQDGVLFLLDMGAREAALYGQGKGLWYLTDKAQERILDSYIMPGLQKEDVFAGAKGFLQGTWDCLQAGVSEDANTYDAETGETVTYKEHQRRLTLTELIIALLVSVGAGTLASGRVKKTYSMAAEKQSAGQFRLSAHTEASVSLDMDRNDRQLINHLVTRTPLPRQNTGNAGRGGGSFGGGQTTVHTNSSGHSYTSSSRKF